MSYCMLRIIFSRTCTEIVILTKETCSGRLQFFTLNGGQETGTREH